MPSKHLTTDEQLYHHILFWPVIVSILLLWFGYRFFFHFPVWFDETIGKAVFFGLPFWFYVVVSKRKSLLEPISFSRFETGLFLGLAVGGIYGFTTAIVSLIQRGGMIESAALFSSTFFWYEFALALLTGFWESLFFFVFLAGVINQKINDKSLNLQILLTVGLFLVFHLPNIILRANQAAIPIQLGLLFLFALGQSLLFFRWRNLYALTLSHAIWGMVLLIHTSF